MTSRSCTYVWATDSFHLNQCIEQSIFWDMIPSRLAHGYQCLRGASCLRLQSSTRTLESSPAAL